MSALNTHFDITSEELCSLENQILYALKSRSIEGLNVLGFGEIGVAIAWPPENPRMVIKRIIATDSAEDASFLLDRIRHYVEGIETHVAVAPTELRTIEHYGKHVPFMLQKLFHPDQLVENIMESMEPDNDHPIVTRLTRAIVDVASTKHFALDAQFTNFAWQDDQLVMFDIGTPLTYGDDGRSNVDFGPVLQTMPAVLRPLIARVLQDFMSEMGGLRGALQHAAHSLPRIEQDRWLEPVLQVFNEVLLNAGQDALSAETIQNRISHMRRRLFFVKSMMRLQRFWKTKVRREHYDYFITDSFTGELL